MHIYFSGIGGMAIGPLALIAKQAGYTVSGSDKQGSQYIDYLQEHGINNIHVSQTYEQIAAAHAQEPINWYVYSSAVAIENPDAPELKFCKDHNIKTSKRDELLNQIIQDKKLKLVAIAGTHGKTTTTAMVIWLFNQLGWPASYSVGAKIPFGDMGQYQDDSEYFIYEADEFDRNFLAFKPYLSLISGVSWDHHEIFPTREDYQQAFRQFIGQSKRTILWKRDMGYLGLEPSNNIYSSEANEPNIEKIKLPGLYNRQDAWLAIQVVAELTQEPYDKLIEFMNHFPGLHRRMEQIIPGLYSDEAHTPDKIRGGMSVALELFQQSFQKSPQLQALMESKKAPSTASEPYQAYGERGAQALMPESAKPGVVVVYEPLTNRRQHYMVDDYKDCFKGAKKVYWLPSYLAREDPGQRIIPPQEMISHLADPSIAQAGERGDKLTQTIQQHLDEGDMVVAMAGGGGGSLDEWIREQFST